MLDFLKEVGVTTMALSIACLDNNLINQRIIKTKDYKQTSQRFENRKNIENVIKLNIKLDKTKKYLLLDDVITSGSSIKTCLNLLRKQGINKVKVLVVSDNYHK